MQGIAGGEKPHQTFKRRTYIVDRSFQYAFMARFTGMVVSGILLAFLILTGWFLVKYSRSDLAMKFFYITGEPGSSLKQTNLMNLVIPSLAVSAVLSCIFTLAFGLFYSHRIAGPIYNLKKALREVRGGKVDRVVKFRKGDEFHDLAEEINKTIAWVRRKLPRRR